MLKRCRIFPIQENGDCSIFEQVVEIPMTSISRISLIAAGCVLIACGAGTVASAQTVSWEASFGGAFNEGGYAGVHCSEGSYCIIGSTYSFGEGDHDVYLLKLDSLGEKVWAETFGGPATEYGYAMTTAPDGGFILVGTTTSFGAGSKDVYVVRTDPNGAFLWQRTYGGESIDEGWSVIATSDGGYLLCGTTSSFGAGSSDIYILRCDANGDLRWSKTFGGPNGEAGYAICAAPDGGYLVVGSTGSFGTGYSSVYAVRIDESGDSLWTAVYGGAKADFGYCATSTYDNGFLIGGTTASSGAGYSDAYLIKIDGSGFVLWEKTFGGAQDDLAYSVTQTEDGGVILVGKTDSFGFGKSDLYAVKTDETGYLLWEHTFGGSKTDFGRCALPFRRSVLLIGYSYSYTVGGSDVYVVKLDEDAPTDVDDDGSAPLPGRFTVEQNFPNPFNLETTIAFSLSRRSDVTIAIFNATGQRVREWELGSKNAGRHLFTWDGRTRDGNIAASGLYFYRIEAENRALTKKMLLLK
jgi:hypothetical protein